MTTETALAEFYPNKLAAFNYVIGQGWQCSQSGFYAHCKAGQVPREKNGTYSRKALDRYAAKWLRRLDTGLRLPDEAANVAEETERVKLAREKTRLEKEILELAEQRGELVSREEVEQMIVGRAVAMLAHLRAMVHMTASDAIALVEGNQQRQRELISFLHDKIEEHLAIFARDIEFEVIFEKNADGPDDLDDGAPAEGAAL